MKHGLIPGVLLLLLLSSCASTPEDSIPGWITSPPADSGNALYFVASGTDPAGSLAEARQRAAGNVITEVTRRLGVRVSSESTLQAVTTLNEYRERLTEAITEESAASIEEITIEESYMRRTESGGVSVFLLVRYDRQAYEKEKARLQALFTEKQEAISVPEQNGDTFAAESSWFRAAESYLAAAAAAAQSDVDNRKVKFERNIRKASESLGELVLLPVSGPATAQLNAPFSEPFIVRLTSRDGSPVSGARLTVTYPAARPNGTTVIQQQRLVTDRDGRAVFNPEKPGYLGERLITFSIDFSALLEPLEDVEKDLYSSVEGLLQQVNKIRTSFSYLVVSQGRSIPTGIVILDLDRSGMPTGKNDTASGLMEVLSGDNFQVRLLGEGEDLLDMRDSQILEFLRSRYLSEVDRVIFGSAQITGFSDSDGYFLVKVEGNFKAVDLKTGALLFAGSPVKNVRARSANTAVSTAFRELGKSFGEEVKLRL